MGKRSAVVILCAVGLAACDPITGVRREAPVQAVPPADQVRSIVRSVPGVDSVGYRHLGDSTRGYVTVEFPYRGGSDVRGSLLFYRDSGGMRYRQSDERTGDPPPQREIDATLLVMRAIEARLATLPGLAGLPARVVQTCSRVDC